MNAISAPTTIAGAITAIPRTTAGTNKGNRIADESDARLEKRMTRHRQRQT
jgi:hypothetical protein